MEEDTNGFDIFKLLQPDLLTREELSSVLKSRCVKADWNSLPKEKLVELFIRVALPLPQREYAQTARGLKLTKLRQKQQNTVTFGDSSKSNKKTYTIGLNGVGNSSSVKPIIKDRLKPPPSIAQPNSTNGTRLKVPPEPVKTEHRKIKIHLSSSTESQLDKVVINDHKKQRLDRPEKTTEDKPIEQTSVQNISNPEVHATKKITLKRNNLGLQTENQITKSNDVTSEIVEKKRKTITWP